MSTPVDMSLHVEFTVSLVCQSRVIMRASLPILVKDSPVGSVAFCSECESSGLVVGRDEYKSLVRMLEIESISLGNCLVEQFDALSITRIVRLLCDAQSM